MGPTSTPKDVNEWGANMQSEEIEVLPAGRDVPIEMTFGVGQCDSPRLDDAKLVLIDDVQPVNLEDDIEKVEMSSPSSSSATGEEARDAAAAAAGPRGAFPGIPDQNPNESIKSWLQRISDLQKKLNFEATAPPVPAAPRVVKFQDLPYMGEMTLDNSKPRRGRKPKKADICHLIYKNYGTIFPGTPNAKSYLDSSKKLDPKDDSLKSDVQSRIISSLLEKRLTQEFKKNDAKRKEAKKDQNEPLNLCIRDLNHLKIRLLKKNDNTYTSEIKSEPQSDDDVEFVHETPSPASQKGGELRFSATPDSLSTPSPTQENGIAPGGYVYWPNAGVFIHPMALQQHLMYYQRLAATNSYTLPNHSPRPPPDALEPSELRKLVPKRETEATVEAKTKRPSPSERIDKTPAKRKRSAIFIPPIPTENNTNPATEVSICKFKFTGGAKPSLQEKKMLSVDSGGNFRYYSGTGDKSMRGYEFFPRETLQQQISSSQGSSTGAFLKASGEKIYPTSPDFTGTKANADFLLGASDAAPPPPATPAPAQQQDLKQKKRKSRKSLQREKLEQTFKEKGFLIQTQQLESAEGATYCKFRQLRKFTRYLFRSWKDYLPGNVRELQDGEKIDDVVEHDELSRNSSELSSNNVQ